MTIDYDVVIIGGTLAGRYAALTATQLHAKVALVEPKVNYGFVYSQTISEISNLAQRLNNAVGLNIHLSQVENPENTPISVAVPEALLYAKNVITNLEAQHSLANLAAMGVDVICENGQFQSSPHLVFAVSQRLLRARTYLLATGSRPAIPEIEGLATTEYLTLANIWKFLNKRVKSMTSLPQEWVILGGVPQSIEVAQTLARLGCHVTLVIKRPQILPDIDPEIAQLLQAQLEIDGVRILTNTPVTQVMRIDDKKWIQAGDKAIETDEIIVATGQQPNVESLNLAAVEVKWYKRHLVVNDKLQTTNPRIYACGDVIGGYDFANIANYEARIAIKNALFFSRLRVNYRCIPLGIFSQPMLAQIGLTETKARQRYNPNEILVLRQYFKSLASAQIRGETTGICKLIVLRSGEILGAEILGSTAGDLINLIALAMSQNTKIQHLENLSPLYPSFTEIIEQCARDWHRQKSNSNIAWQEFIESLFAVRRDWNL
ncbi:NAD(P)/FAD-dependent oxidoreductase [Nostoc linckia FACHB-104]|nr:NAD(P)/FAD-dependent oxidoreductase [Nostoc linckia FACHB-104]